MAFYHAQDGRGHEGPAVAGAVAGRIKLARDLAQRDPLVAYTLAANAPTNLRYDYVRAD